MHKPITVVDMGRFRLKTVVVAAACWFTLALEEGHGIGMEAVCDESFLAFLEGFQLEMAVLDDPRPF